MYCGFSGADLDFDENYLGLKAAADESPGFAFVYRSSDPPRPSIRALGDAYGSKASFVEAALDEWFAALAGELGVALPPSPAVEVSDPRAEVANGLDRWAESLSPMEAVNTVSALLEAGGNKAAALWLLHKTWWWDRGPDETSGPSYPQYLFNYGRLALEAGDKQDGETIQNFYRTQKEIPEAAVYAGVYLAYEGRRADALGFFREACRRVEAGPSAKLDAELALGRARYSRIYGDHADALELIEKALPAVVADGDQPRQARLLAAAAYIYAQGGNVDEATRALEEATSLAGHIGDIAALADLAIARGAILLQQEDYEGAKDYLGETAEFLAENKLLPLRLDASLDWIEAAQLAQADDEAWAVYHATEPVLLAGYAPRFFLIMARFHLARHRFDDARRNLDVAADEAAKLENDWIGAAVEQTRTILEERAATAQQES